MENEISGSVHSRSVQSKEPDSSRKWYIRDFWALLVTVIGIVILSFVIVTGAKYVVWTLWIGVPFIMIGLAYFAIVSLLRFFWRKDL